MGWSGRVGIAAALSWGLGCGSGASRSPADGGSGGASGHDGAIAACVAGVGDAGQAAVATQDLGRLIFTQGWGTDGSVEGVLQAYFLLAGQLLYPPPGRDDFGIPSGWVTEPPGVCVVMTVGACTVFTTDCDIPAEPSCVAPQAGAISVRKGASTTDLVVPLQPSADGTYPPHNVLSVAIGVPTPPVFAEGDVLTVSGTGADVPSFQMNVAAPGCVDLTAPTGPTDRLTNPLASINVATGQDLSLTWTGGEAGATLGLDLTGGAAGAPRFVDVSCTFQASDGQGTVPQAALGALSGSAGGELTAYQQTSTSKQVGAFEVELDVRNLGGGGSAPDGGTCPLISTRVSYQ